MLPDRIIDAFVVRAQAINTQAELLSMLVNREENPACDRVIHSFCTQEVASQYEAYAPNTAHSHITALRKAIEQHGLAETFLKYLVQDRELTRERRIDYIDGRTERQKKRIPILNPDALVQRAEDLLSSHDYRAIMVGLELLTGRRPVEIGVTGRFTPLAEDDQSALFGGQAKTRRSDAEAEPYPIPLLRPYGEITAAIKTLREQTHCQTLSRPAFDSVIGANVRPMRQRLFRDLLPASAFTRKEMLRKIYAIIAYDWFCPSETDDVVYIPGILGHRYRGERGEKIATETGLSYRDFYLAEVE